eukprot:m.202589 g.202589  ORF g.202589 m.202589 type:complete len:74 (+) comp14977_c1_seq14:1450-1671(+)
MMAYCLSQSLDQTHSPADLFHLLTGIITTHHGWYTVVMLNRDMNLGCDQRNDALLCRINDRDNAKLLQDKHTL